MQVHPSEARRNSPANVKRWEAIAKRQRAHGPEHDWRDALGLPLVIVAPFAIVWLLTGLLRLI